MYKKYKKIFKEDAKEVAFLLGGIGTGNISIDSRGNFRDLEIFNAPSEGLNPPYTFFAIWAKEKDKNPIVRKIEAQKDFYYSSFQGFYPHEVSGIPHFKSSKMLGEYPFVWIDFKDEELPIDVTLEAFTPFIPLNADDSGIPCAIIRYKVRNKSESKIEVSMAGSMANFLGKENCYYQGFFTGSSNILINKFIAKKLLRGMYFSIEDIDTNDLHYGNMSLITTNDNVSAKPNWSEGGWFDGLQDFWDDFKKDGKLDIIDYESFSRSEIQLQSPKVGSIAINNVLNPKEELTFEFIFTWYFPNRLKGWESDKKNCCSDNIVKNYYTNLFSDSLDVATYVVKNLDRLEKYSRKFHGALFSSTLPDYVIDAISSNITVLRSNTCFRIEDGTFLGWEGCGNGIGCCPGSCTHVWNYAQTVAFLFPELEQSMRKVEFNLETNNIGKMNFRTIKAFGKKNWTDSSFRENENLPPATDGQLGSIIRLYRDWKISGDNRLIRNLWDKAKKALDFVIKVWDTDMDCVLDGKKHNTYDIEFYGPEPLSNGLFYTALKAVIEIAEYLEDKKAKEKYKEILRIGPKRMDEMLWNGRYYIQKIEDIDKYKYQFGIGCLSDQLFGQLLAHICGLGYILPKNHVKKAIKSIYDNNFITNFENHHNVQRVYALNDEKGLILCSWPKGGRPKFPFVYSDEVWSGVEYQVAAHLIYEGFTEEGLNIVKATRERYDGYKRNPYNEIECGNHYVRSMASWSLLLALSGFKYDMVKKEISFDPKVNKDNFKVFFCIGKTWGTYIQKKDSRTGRMKKRVKFLYGDGDLEIKNNK